ncbi:MAG: HEAT repeat domain-containing protein [Deltaproteobacteria bacterium]|nr:HEAT repeat domain-containing protein [Deltaproteobacteria bacterium]
MRKPGISPVLLLLAAIAASLAFSCAGTIVESPDVKLEGPEQIKAALKGDDFRKKNQAREKLATLDPADRLAVLQDLLKEGDAPTRLLAVAELLNLAPEVYTPILTDVAANDPDPEIREFAAAAIEPEPSVTPP